MHDQEKDFFFFFNKKKRALDMCSMCMRDSVDLVFLDRLDLVFLDRLGFSRIYYQTVRNRFCNN